jgi:uncharacterized protein
MRLLLTLLMERLYSGNRKHKKTFSSPYARINIYAIVSPGYIPVIHGEKTMSDENCTSGNPILPDPDYLLRLARAKMPFGKYAGRYLIDLPEAYVIWFSHKGFPGGQLGEMLKAVLEIKANGLEYLFIPLREKL